MRDRIIRGWPVNDTEQTEILNYWVPSLRTDCASTRTGSGYEIPPPTGDGLRLLFSFGIALIGFFLIF